MKKIRQEERVAQLLDHIPRGVVVYRISESKKIIYANKRILDLFECEMFEDFCIFMKEDDFGLLDIGKQNQLFDESVIRKQHLAYTRKGHFLRLEEYSFQICQRGQGLLVFLFVKERKGIPKPVTVCIDRKKEILNRFEQALEEDVIEAYYQPVVSTKTEKVIGYEALARWHDTMIGEVKPDEFIPIMEEVDRILKLDLFMVERVCRDMHDRVVTLPVSFNLSRLDFMDENIFTYVDEIVERYQIPRSMLRVEITETLRMQQSNQVHEMIRHFQQAGYEVWLDDFGTGYSSLGVLNAFAFDGIKIDQSFMKCFNHRTREILVMILRLSKRLGVQTLVEGVETENQVQFLRMIDCDFIQGYYFGKPKKKPE